MVSNCTSGITQIMFILLNLFLLISVNTVENFTVLNLSKESNDLMETSTNSPSINEQKNSYTFSQNNSITTQNTSIDTAFKTTTTSKSENSGDLSRPQQVKIVTPSTTYDSDSSSSSGLSAGAIAGIVISVVSLVCCAGICGACRKAGYLKNRRN